jgi:hypothetical protein
MRHLSPPYLLITATTGVSVGMALASCSGNGSSTSAGGAATSSGSGGADAGDAGTDHHADVTDATEEPVGEAGWVPVSWKAPCYTEVAQHPEFAAPKLTWGPCPGGGAPGCEGIVVNWEKGSGPPLAAVTVVPWGDRVGALLSYPGPLDRCVVFDTDGTPLMAWQVVHPCLAATPRVGPTRVWFGVQGDSSSAFIVGTYENVASSPEAASTIMGWQGIDSNDTTLSVWGLTGTMIAIYDRLGNQANTFSPSPGLGYHVGHPVNDSALMLYFPVFDHPEAWIWNRSTHKTEPFIQPSPDVVTDVRSDGATIVWLQAPAKDPQNPYYGPGDLWTSPFAASKAVLKPTKRRPVPAVGGVVGAAGQGYYAMNGATPDRKIHVYRLSDAQHWEFVPPKEAYNLWDVSYVDPKYVWYWTVTGMYRQALDALGPGDPAP